MVFPSLGQKKPQLSLQNRFYYLNGFGFIDLINFNNVARQFFFVYYMLQIMLNKVLLYCGPRGSRLPNSQFASQRAKKL